MNRDILIEMIESRHSWNSQDFSSIQKLAVEYPYCSTLKMLQARGAKETNQLELRKYINSASVYVQDRSKLYDYVVRDGVLKQILEESTEGRGDKEITTTDDSSTKVELNNLNEDPLEQQIMAAAVMHIGELEVDSYVEHHPEKHSSARDSQKGIAKKPSSLSDFLTSIDRTSAKPENAIIEKFVSEDRIIAPVKKAFFSPSQMGKMSLMEDESFVTETLAKIYERQGDYKKAARAYKNLGLKYPEKRTYFADLQKKAEEHL